MNKKSTMEYEELDERDKVLYEIAQCLIDYYSYADRIKLYVEENNKLITQSIIEDLVELLNPMDLIYPLLKDTELDDMQELEYKVNNFYPCFERNDFRFPAAEKRVKRMFESAFYYYSKHLD